MMLKYLFSECHNCSTVSWDSIDPDTAEATIFDDSAAYLDQKWDVLQWKFTTHGTLLQRDTCNQNFTIIQKSLLE